MSLNVKTIKSGGEKNLFNNLEVDVYPARVVQVINLGLQKNTYPGSEGKPPAVKVHFTFELDALMLDKDGNEIEDKPHWLSNSFFLHNISNDRATSSKIIKALDPELKLTGGDVFKCINLPCQISVASYQRQDKTEGFKIGAVLASSKRKPAPELINEPLVYDAFEHNEEVFAKLPSFLQDQIKEGWAFLKEVEPAVDKSKKANKTSKVEDPTLDDEIPY